MHMNPRYAFLYARILIHPTFRGGLVSLYHGPSAILKVPQLICQELFFAINRSQSPDVVMFGIEELIPGEAGRTAGTLDQGGHGFNVGNSRHVKPRYVHQIITLAGNKEDYIRLGRPARMHASLIDFVLPAC